MRTELRPKLGRWIDGRIEVSAEPLLRFRQRLHDVREPSVADDQEIHIALRAELTARRGTEHEGDENPLAERGEPLTKQIDEPGGLRKQALQLGEDRRVPVGLEVHLPAIDGAQQQSGGRQLLQLPLHRANRSASVPCDLAKVVRLLRMAEQPREHAPAGAPEEDRARIGAARPRACSHSGDKSTQIGNRPSNPSLPFSDCQKHEGPPAPSGAGGPGTCGLGPQVR